MQLTATSATTAPEPAELVMPDGYTYASFEATPAARAAVEACPTCQTGGFAPRHWPSPRCGGGNSPGKPIRPHCACDACF
ncbi:hypothetical protein CLV30_12862 [Haloactinopolyspora alba]|uniref:Uncharacterized protein n=1 Tax=Haloactinopolyspora alba TaxID=648780 RepID=A0A2P8DF28_9ACTN|nr:hypothetical protein [Haloactinopolyspora alba]PSK95810.1 hypothetical protein CLV30_12862 [Haloactinopolyspora alba]